MPPDRSLSLVHTSVVNFIERRVGNQRESKIIIISAVIRQLRKRRNPNRKDQKVSFFLRLQNEIISRVTGSEGEKERTNHKTLVFSLISSRNWKIFKSG